MNPNPPRQSASTSNSHAPGTATRKMVRERAVELAVINGHPAQDVSKADWEQAKRELGVETNLDHKTAVLEAAPESERWDVLPGNTGHKVPICAGAEEDDGGRSANEQLVAEGVARAEQDLMFQAGKRAQKSN